MGARILFILLYSLFQKCMTLITHSRNTYSIKEYISNSLYQLTQAMFCYINKHPQNLSSLKHIYHGATVAFLHSILTHVYGLMVPPPPGMWLHKVEKGGARRIQNGRQGPDQVTVKSQGIDFGVYFQCEEIK